ncbi:MAG: hypothetical protein HY453_01795 [Parcubacteria group bacterium]|nr:hypothetical protein [Parcubacteria group bacterium]
MTDKKVIFKCNDCGNEGTAEGPCDCGGEIKKMCDCGSGEMASECCETEN